MTGFRAKAFRASEYLTTKFGSPERYKGIAQRVVGGGGRGRPGL